jgi:hypothetical protein
VHIDTSSPVYCGRALPAVPMDDLFRPLDGAAR